MDEDDRPRYLFVLAGSFNHCEKLTHISPCSQSCPVEAIPCRPLLILQADWSYYRFATTACFYLLLEPTPFRQRNKSHQ